MTEITGPGGETWFIHKAGNQFCYQHSWQERYLGQGFWGRECRECGCLVELKVPGYNCPEENDANPTA